MSIGIYNNLISQLDKLRRHNRQGSIKTKRSYYEAMKRFCRFLANEYRLEKLSNIAPKHLHAYVVHMQDRGYAAGTIKSNLSAIRFWHDKMRCSKPSVRNLVRKPAFNGKSYNSNQSYKLQKRLDSHEIKSFSFRMWWR